MHGFGKLMGCHYANHIFNVASVYDAGLQEWHWPLLSYSGHNQEASVGLHRSVPLGFSCALELHGGQNSMHWETQINCLSDKGI